MISVSIKNAPHRDELVDFCNNTFGPAVIRISNKKKKRMWIVGKVTMHTEIPPGYNPWTQSPSVIVSVVTTVSFRNLQDAMLFKIKWA